MVRLERGDLISPPSRAPYGQRCCHGDQVSTATATGCHFAVLVRKAESKLIQNKPLRSHFTDAISHTTPPPKCCHPLSAWSALPAGLHSLDSPGLHTLVCAAAAAQAHFSKKKLCEMLQFMIHKLKFAPSGYQTDVRMLT